MREENVLTEPVNLLHCSAHLPFSKPSYSHTGLYRRKHLQHTCQNIVYICVDVAADVNHYGHNMLQKRITLAQWKEQKDLETLNAAELPAADTRCHPHVTCSFFTEHAETCTICNLKCWSLANIGLMGVNGHAPF